jgi:hypothetical protein
MCKNGTATLDYKLTVLLTMNCFFCAHYRVKWNDLAFINHCKHNCLAWPNLFQRNSFGWPTIASIGTASLLSTILQRNPTNNHRTASLVPTIVREGPPGSQYFEGFEDGQLPVFIDGEFRVGCWLRVMNGSSYTFPPSPQLRTQFYSHISRTWVLWNRHHHPRITLKLCTLIRLHLKRWVWSVISSRV